MEMYDKVEKFVTESFKRRGKTGGIGHLLRTVRWIKHLKPDADEALLIAGISHDIERAFRDRRTEEEIEKSSKGFMDEEFLRRHQERGAEIIGEFLEDEGADEKTVGRVKMLVSGHEEGGNDDQNILKDADSVSFFETNADHLMDKLGKEKVRQKFKWMYERITSEKAREIARPLFERAMKKLEATK